MFMSLKNHVHPRVDSNQEFIFLHWKHFVFMNERLVRRKIVGVLTWNLSMGESKQVIGENTTTLLGEVYLYHVV